MTTEKLPWLPHAIYYDTNALRKLPHTLHDPSFEAVVGFAKEFNCKLFLPEVAFDEWLHALVENLKNCLERSQNNAKFLESLLDRPVLDHKKPDVGKIVAEFRAKHVERVKAAGIQIAVTPKLEIGSLLAQAVKKVPPFESGDKGFRDAVIVETAAQHAAGNYDNPRILLISDDKAVQNSKRRFTDRGIVAVICSAEKAMDVLNESLTEAVKVHRKFIEKAALEFLTEHQESVFEFITASEIELSSLESKLNEIRPIGLPKIRRLDAGRPIKIVSAEPGGLHLGGELPPDRYPFPFEVEVEFDLTIEYLLLGAPVDRRSMPLGHPVNVEALPHSSPIPREPALESMTMVCEIRVEATVSTEGAEGRSYKDLQMTKIYPWRVVNQNPFMQPS